MEAKMNEEPVNPKIIACKYCGQNIPETTNFCWYCGRELIARPERPDNTPSFRVSSKVLLITLIIISVGVIVLVWSLTAR
jgi:hypothetical protein